MRLDHLLSKGKSRGVHCCWSAERLEPCGAEKGGARDPGVAMRAGDTPVPIPNTTVKAGTADGTALETVWESRWLRQIFFGKTLKSFYIYLLDFISICTLKTGYRTKILNSKISKKKNELRHPRGTLWQQCTVKIIIQFH